MNLDKVKQKKSESNSGKEEIILEIKSPDEFQKEARQILHDYQASIRTFRYLASKAMREEDPNTEATQRKKAAVERHLKTLEEVRDSILLKVLSD